MDSDSSVSRHDGAYVEGVGWFTSHRELAQTYARLELERADPERRNELVRLGSVVGLRPAELQRISGLSRQTVYTAIRHTDKPTADLFLWTLAILAADGASTITSVAGQLRAEEPVAESLLRGLADGGYVRIATVGFSEPGAAVFMLSDRGQRALAERAQDLALRQRPDVCFISLAVDTEESDRLEEAARAIVGRNEWNLLDASIHSTMRGPELALLIPAVTSREAINTMYDLWQEIRSEAELDPRLPKVALHVPPQPRRP